MPILISSALIRTGFDSMNAPTIVSAGIREDGQVIRIVDAGGGERRATGKELEAARVRS
jgi:hypothetical protein